MCGQAMPDDRAKVNLVKWETGLQPSFGAAAGVEMGALR